MYLQVGLREEIGGMQARMNNIDRQLEGILKLLQSSPPPQTTRTSYNDVTLSASPVIPPFSRTHQLARQTSLRDLSPHSDLFAAAQGGVGNRGCVVSSVSGYSSYSLTPARSNSSIKTATTDVLTPSGDPNV